MDFSLVQAFWVVRGHFAWAVSRFCWSDPPPQPDPTEMHVQWEVGLAPSSNGRLRLARQGQRVFPSRSCLLETIPIDPASNSFCVVCL